MLWLYEKVRKTLVTVFLGKWFMTIESVRGISILNDISGDPGSFWLRKYKEAQRLAMLEENMC